MDLERVGFHGAQTVSAFLTRGKPAEYTVAVKNDGNVPLDNVSVAVTLPPGFKVTKASQDAQSMRRSDRTAERWKSRSTR